MKQHMRWKKGARLLTAMVAGALVASLSPSVASAEIIGSCGDVNLMDPLPDVRPHVSEDAENLQIFQEAKNRRLDANLTVDARNVGNYDNEPLLPVPKPVIPAGTMVDSFFIHADSPGNDPGTGIRYRATLTFATEDQKIGMESFVEQGPGKARFVGR